MSTIDEGRYARSVPDDSVGPRFLHASDLHLGAPISSFGGQIPERTAARLRKLARGAYTRLVDVAIDSRVAFVVIAGDLFDHADTEVAAQSRLVDGLERLGEAGIQVFVALGNFDPPARSLALARPLPANVTVFPSGELQVYRIPIAGVGGDAVLVAGISHAAHREVSNLAARFRELPPLSTQPVVGVLHANVNRNPDHDDLAPCTGEDLSLAPVHYFALGHVHTRSVNQLGFGRWWAYSGNLQGRSTVRSECGAKGALIVPLGQPRLGEPVIGEPEFVACDAVRFVALDIDVTSMATIEEALSALGAKAALAALEADDRPLVARARFVGSSAVHDQLWVRRDELLRIARSEIGSGDDATGGLLGDGVLVRVDVDTRPPYTRAQLLARGDLAADVISEIDRWRSHGGDGTRLRDVIALASSGVDNPTRAFEDLRAILEPAAGHEEHVRSLILDHAERVILGALVSREGPSR